MIAPADLTGRALSRLADQYKNSTNLRALLTGFIAELEEVQTALLELEALRKISTAFGAGLDGLGEILGQPRELAGVVPIDYFGFHDGDGGPASEGFGDENDASAGLRFRSENEAESGNKLLGDAEYRQFLEAKKIRNDTEATPEDVIEAIQAVLPDDPPVAVHLTPQYPAGGIATVQRVLSAEELLILNAKAGIRGEIPVIPRPAGVSLTVQGL